MARTWPSPTLVVVCLARVYRALLLTLLVVAVVPTAWGWDGYLVRSASMEPNISRSDVVIASPLPEGSPVPIGRVMVFANPADPEESIVHRVVGRAAPGAYTTSGDANHANDSTSVPRSHFQARAVLLVPFIGLPLTWLHGGDTLLLAVWISLTLAALLIAAQPRLARHRDRSSPGEGDVATGGSAVSSCSDAAPPPDRTNGRLGGPPISYLALIATVSFAAVTTTPASAAFSATTISHDNGWTATTTRMLQSCTAPVIADHPYFYYLLDEDSGSSMADSSGNGRPGTATALSGYGQTAGLPTCAGSSVAFNAAQGRVTSGGTALPNPTTYSLELWFRTTTTQGGKLVGFESTRNATSTTYDRTVLMLKNGRLVYRNGASAITTTQTYNNGNWHHLVLAASPNLVWQQATLYIDGVSVSSSDLLTAPSNYSGWWRIGYGSVPTGTNYPSSGNFVGSVDNAAVYQTELSATQIAAHYAAR